ncbi:28S ribosomal protein S23, mitochondrial-like [Salarias fasciatus]|uniref:28S ribosomal protein S23, mitochondrial-like n=1 Tax=Salarias fasciatus TaxID=181472 RepID=UPI001176CE81|nr:28S ribosomal protein S23, mitochondrial-like [Salarias fasciatus]
MAGSRLEKLGTVFSRVRDLMQSGVMKPEAKPVWYDVYQASPPKMQPLYVKPCSHRLRTKKETVSEIFYSEDEIRARFYEQYGTGPRVIDLSKPYFVSTCQRFVEKYEELRSKCELKESPLFEEAGKALLAEGVILRKRGALPAPAESRNPVLELKLIDMLAEQQSVQET